MAPPSTQNLPVRDEHSEDQPTQDQSTSTTAPTNSGPEDKDIDLLPLISAWLDSANTKISEFWIGADWRGWARYDLWLHLNKSLSSTHLMYHTFYDIWDSEQIDIWMEPYDSDQRDIAIVLRCERVNENCGSYEQFREEMDGDIERIKALPRVDGMYAGTRMLVVGFSGPVPDPNEESEWKCRPEPRQFGAGEVNGWIYEMELEGTDDVPQPDE